MDAKTDYARIYLPMEELSPVQYKIPLAVWRDLIFAFLLRRQRSVQVDSRRTLANPHPPMRVLGAEHIPQGGPALITLNHYWAPGFWAPWMAMAVNSVVPVTVGQYILIIPSLNAVVVRLGTDRSKKYHNHAPSEVYSYLDAAFELLEK